MHVIDLLEQDHREVDELFRRFQLASKPETLDEIARAIVHELSVHAAVEEQFVYPLVRTVVGGDPADHAIEEHAEVKQLLADIEKLDAGSDEHAETMSRVIDAVRHHVDEEEDNVFRRLRDGMDDDVLERVGSLVASAKHVVPTHPHPLVPGTATAQLVAGPWAAIVDKARDLVGR